MLWHQRRPRPVRPETLRWRRTIRRRSLRRRAPTKPQNRQRPRRRNMSSGRRPSIQQPKRRTRNRQKPSPRTSKHRKLKSRSASGCRPSAGDLRAASPRHLLVARQSLSIGSVPAARRIGPVLNFSLYVKHFTAESGHWTNTGFEPDRREAIMPSPDNQTRSKPGIDWLGIVRIVLFQVLVLLALSAAVVRYVNWSSDAARAEFTAGASPHCSVRPNRRSPRHRLRSSKVRKCAPGRRERDGLRRADERTTKAPTTVATRERVTRYSSGVRD